MFYLHGIETRLSRTLLHSPHSSTHAPLLFVCLFVCLDRRPPAVRTPKTRKEILHRRHAEHVPNDGRVLHALRRNRKELAEQIHNAVELQNHPQDGPPEHDQDDATEEADNPAEPVFAGKESDGPGKADCEGETDQKQ